jgi:hypothetical protein
MHPVGAAREFRNIAGARSSEPFLLAAGVLLALSPKVVVVVGPPVRRLPLAVERMSRAEWRERAEARLEVAHRLLVAGVEKLQSGEDCRRYLEVQAQLHSYSPRNVML